MDNKQVINKWFRLLVDGIYRYDDTIRIEDIYKLVEDMDSIDIVNTYYMKDNTEFRVAEWADSKSESSIEKILEKRGVKYLKKQVGNASNYLFFLNDGINFYAIDKRPHSIFLNIFNAKTSKLENYIDISDYKELAMYIDTLMINMKNEIKVDTEKMCIEKLKVEIDGKDIPIKDGDILVLENDKVVQVYKN